MSRPAPGAPSGLRPRVRGLRARVIGPSLAVAALVALLVGVFMQRHTAAVVDEVLGKRAAATVEQLGAAASGATPTLQLRVEQEARQEDVALVVVTHHLQEGLAVASHAAIMRAGKFVRFATTEGLDAAAYAAEYREAVA